MGQRIEENLAILEKRYTELTKQYQTIKARLETRLASLTEKKGE